MTKSEMETADITNKLFLSSFLKKYQCTVSSIIYQISLYVHCTSMYCKCANNTYARVKLRTPLNWDFCQLKQNSYTFVKLVSSPTSVSAPHGLLCTFIQKSKCSRKLQKIAMRQSCTHNSSAITGKLLGMMDLTFCQYPNIDIHIMKNI